MLTLAQLYNLGKSENIDLFSGVTLPEDSPLNRDLIINTIITKCGLNIPMYADPYIFKSAVDIWSAKNQYMFLHLGKLLTASYSPIEGSVRSYKETRTRDLKDDNINKNTSNIGESSNTTDITTTGAVSVKDSDNTVTHTGTDTTTETDETSAFNATTYQDKDKITTELVHGEEVGTTANDTITESSNKLNTNENIKNKDITSDTINNKNLNENEYIDHFESGMSKYSYQELMTQEFELLDKFSPYDFIAERFENELTLFVY